MILIVDDTPDVDSEIFNMEDFEGSDWVLISDEVPVDESRRDELIERFQVTGRPVSADVGDDEVVEEEEELEGVDVEEL